MKSKKKVYLKILENLTDSELNAIIEGLKKIGGYQFQIEQQKWIPRTVFVDNIDSMPIENFNPLSILV